MSPCLRQPCLGVPKLFIFSAPSILEVLAVKGQDWRRVKKRQAVKCLRPAHKRVWKEESLSHKERASHGFIICVCDFPRNHRAVNIRAMTRLWHFPERSVTRSGKEQVWREGSSRPFCYGDIRLSCPGQSVLALYQRLHWRRSRVTARVLKAWREEGRKTLGKKEERREGGKEEGKGEEKHRPSLRLLVRFDSCCSFPVSLS